jgi:hypothetical protein
MEPITALARRPIGERLRPLGDESRRCAGTWRHCYAMRTLALLMAATRVALSQNPAPCTGPEYHQMDFIIGRWAGVESDIKGNDTTRTVTGSITTEATLTEPN